MSWEAERVLEGVFHFGAPVNIWEMELDKESSDDLGYYCIHMLIDNDLELAGRLKMKMSSGSGGEFQRLIVMESPKTRSVHADNWIEHSLYGAWLYSLQTDYSPEYYPFGIWKGWTLGIAFNKTKANEAAVAKLFHGYHSI
jgi:hypothetical protein